MAIAQRLAQLGAGAAAQHQRQAAQDRAHRRHHDRTEAQDAGLVDRLLGRQVALALGAQREVHHHDAVLLDDADQHDDADQRDHAEIEAEQQQHQQRADAGRRQRRQDGQRVDEALVEHAQDQVDDRQRGGDQVGRRGQRMPGRPAPCPGTSRSASMRHAELGLDLLDRRHRIAERRAAARLKLTVTDGNWLWWLITR